MCGSWTEWQRERASTATAFCCPSVLRLSVLRLSVLRLSVLRLKELRLKGLRLKGLRLSACSFRRENGKL